MSCVSSCRYESLHVLGNAEKRDLSDFMALYMSTLMIGCCHFGPCSGSREGHWFMLSNVRSKMAKFWSWEWICYSLWFPVTSRSRRSRLACQSHSRALVTKRHRSTLSNGSSSGEAPNGTFSTSLTLHFSNLKVLWA